MNSRFLPLQINNQYQGYKLALWIFWIVIIMRGLQGLSLIIAGPSVVRDADGIPLENFPTAASQSIIAIFVVSGLSRLVLSLMGILIFVRYKSAIPIMFAVLTLDQLGKEILLRVYPVFRVGNPLGPTINLCLLILTFFGLLFSVIGKKNPGKMLM